MRQEEKWGMMYKMVACFIEANHRNLSKYKIEEHGMLNWVKANRKALNAGKMKVERVERFSNLLKLMERYRRVNQYQ